jgi:hypothetical protein
LVLRAYFSCTESREVLAAVVRGALLGRTPWPEGSARNRTDDAVLEVLFSCSDNAKSCLTISAFSAFFALLGSPDPTFAIIANAISAVATPIKTMLII